MLLLLPLLWIGFFCLPIKKGVNDGEIQFIFFVQRENNRKFHSIMRPVSPFATTYLANTPLSLLLPKSTLLSSNGGLPLSSVPRFPFGKKRGLFPLAASVVPVLSIRSEKMNEFEVHPDYVFPPCVCPLRHGALCSRAAAE